MTILYLEALAAIAVSLSVLMAGAWVVQQRTSNSGWVLIYVTGIPQLEAQMLRSRGERYRNHQSRTSQFFPLPPLKFKGVVT